MLVRCSISVFCASFDGCFTDKATATFCFSRVKPTAYYGCFISTIALAQPHNFIIGVVCYTFNDGQTSKALARKVIKFQNFAHPSIKTGISRS